MLYISQEKKTVVTSLRLIWEAQNFSVTPRILAYFVFTLPVMMAELLSGKVIQLGARDTNKLWGCIIPADQSAG